MPSHEYHEILMRMQRIEVHLDRLLAGQQHQEQIMSQTSDAITAIKAELANQTALIQTAVTKLGQIQSTTSDADTAAQLADVLSGLKANDAALSNAENPPATPAPTAG